MKSRQFVRDALENSAQKEVTFEQFENMIDKKQYIIYPRIVWFIVAEAFRKADILPAEIYETAENVIDIDAKIEQRKKKIADIKQVPEFIYTERNVEEFQKQLREVFFFADKILAKAYLNHL